MQLEGGCVVVGHGRCGARGVGEFARTIRRGEAGRDVRSDLAAAVVQGGHGLLGLQQVGMSLEDIFLELTTTDEAEYLYDVCQRVASGYLPESFKEEMEENGLSMYK